MKAATTHGHGCCHAQPPARSFTATSRRTARMLPSVLLSLFIALLPKCPLCWGVYLSMFGSAGLAALPYMRWLLPLLIVLMVLHLFMLYRKAAQRGYLPFAASFCGAIILLCAKLLLPTERWLAVTGLVLMVCGSLLNNFLYLRQPLAVHSNHNH